MAFSRLKVFYCFIAVGVVVVLTSSALVFSWYPGYFFQLDGEPMLFGLVVLVSLLLAPGLSYLLATDNKSARASAFDLSVILILQLLVAVFVVQLHFKNRPLALVYFERAFYSVRADLYENYLMDVGFLYDAPLSEGCLVPCFSVKASVASRQSLVEEGVPARVRGEFYEQYEKNRLDIKNELFDREQTIRMLEEKYKSVAGLIPEANDRHRYSFIYGRNKSLLAVLDADKGVIVAVHDLVE